MPVTVAAVVVAYFFVLPTAKQIFLNIHHSILSRHFVADVKIIFNIFSEHLFILEPQLEINLFASKIRRILPRADNSPRNALAPISFALLTWFLERFFFVFGGIFFVVGSVQHEKGAAKHEAEDFQREMGSVHEEKGSAKDEDGACGDENSANKKTAKTIISAV